MQKFTIFFVVLITLIAVTYVVKASSSEVKNPLISTNLQVPKVPDPTPTPLPFAEMTIPYLKTREYHSRLGELNEYSQNGSYTSYLTSYDSDGLKVNGLLTKPTGQTPGGGWPAVVFVHGYIPPANYQTTANYVSFVDFLARNGLVVFKIDLRGHGNSEGDGGGGYYSADYVIDVLNAYAALQSSGFVKPDGIGLWGHSMSGNITLRAAVAKPEIKGLVVWAGAGYTYTDLQDYSIEDRSYRPPPPDSPSVTRRQALFETHGSFKPESEFWKQVVPTNYLSDFKGSIQIHHAVDDNVVDIRYSRNLNSILDKTSIPHQLFEYPSGGHNMTGSSFTTAMTRTVEFFKNKL